MEFPNLKLLVQADKALLWISSVQNTSRPLLVDDKSEIIYVYDYINIYIYIYIYNIYIYIHGNSSYPTCISACRLLRVRQRNMQIDDLHDGMKKVRREPGSLKRWGGYTVI